MSLSTFFRRSGFVHRDHLPLLSAGAAILITLLPAAQAQDPVSPAEASFVERLQPMVFKNCQGCHTFGGHAGGLRMDTYASLLKGGDRGAVVVPGNPQASLLLKAIRREDPQLQMPPAKKLEDSDITLVEKWIEDVAKLSNEVPKGLPAPVTAVASPPPAQAAQAPAFSPAAPPVAVEAPGAKTPAASEPGAKAVAVAGAEKVTAEQEQFFENKVRPVLTKNCYTCHTTAASGGLRMDSREALLKGGKDGAVVVPGHPESSLLVTAVHYDSKLQMPPTGQLKGEEIASLEKWISDGLPWPKSVVAASARVTPEKRNFWSFRVPVRPAVPEVNSAWVRNDIDRFILAKLAEKNLKPVGDASKRTLIRRATYDLTGLPPTPAEVQAFLDDKASDSYERLIDRLLASKAYGERWGRMWLDVVRYADTAGGGGDYPIPQAYKYRDYVIQAFNSDKPYDRFVREQIAGDLLPSKSEPEHWESVIATGYLAGTVRAEGRPAYIADAVDNLGSAFLGMTVGCARCHDHKFDPIPTADYYAIYGILASTHFPDPGNDTLRFQTGFVYRDPQALNRPDYKVFASQLKPIQDAIVAVKKLPGTYDDLVPQLEVRRMHMMARMPDLGESVYAVTEGEPHDEHIQHYGDPKSLGEQVPRGMLEVLGGNSLPGGEKGSGRLELANWIADKDNPLTARVIVNRIWQGHFGRGIVATANDFGARGMAPSNQALLDYLATQFVDNGWSIKALHKEILLSHAYQLSAADSAANEVVDPDNSLVWRHSRARLDAEEIRDSLLADSGLLDRTPAGPQPFPPQATWNWEDQNHFAPNPADYETDRRTVYTMVQRDVKLQYFTLFDGPNTNASTEQRSSSLTPLQSLYFLNGDFPRRCADQFAKSLLTTAGSDRDRISQAFLTIYGRPPSAAELERSASFLHNASDALATQGVKQGTPQQQAWSEFLKAAFASNEFMFID